MTHHKDLRERLLQHVADLDAAATPTKCEVFTLCGAPARRMEHDIRSLLDENDALRARISELEALNKEAGELAQIGKVAARAASILISESDIEPGVSLRPIAKVLALLEMTETRATKLHAKITGGADNG